MGRPGCRGERRWRREAVVICSFVSFLGAIPFRARVVGSGRFTQFLGERNRTSPRNVRAVPGRFLDRRIWPITGVVKMRLLGTMVHKRTGWPRGTTKGDLGNFIETAPFRIAMLDSGMRYLAASPRWRDEICHGTTNVIGRSHYDIVPDAFERWKDVHCRVLSGETLRGDEERFERRNGDTKWVRWTVSPWCDGSGLIGGIVIHSEDLSSKVTAERHLREENKALARLHDAGWRLRHARNVQEGCQELLSATIELLGADMGNIQLFDRTGRVLRIAAHYGFRQDFLDFFREVSGTDNTACGRALRYLTPVVIEDIDSDPGYAPFRSVAHAANYRAVVSAPLVNRGGKVVGMLSVHFRLPHRLTSRELKWLDLYRRRAGDFIGRLGTEEALRESEERLRLALAAGRMAMFDRDVKAGTLIWNEECYHLFGYQVGEVEPSRSAWRSRVHPDDLEAAAIPQTAMSEGEDFSNEYRVCWPDGSVRWVQTRGRFLYDAGEAIRLIGLIQDVTEVRQQIDIQGVLVAELQHRTRNLMAVVQSIAHQTLNTAESLKDFEERFDRRLQTLSRVQSFLSRASQEPVTLSAILRMELNAVGADLRGDRITVAGPKVPLGKNTVEMLALAIHELATNAVKYGALAREEGQLSVTWRITGTGESQELVLEWLERGVRVSAAARGRRGFGRKLIEEALPYSLLAQTKFELGANTLHCVISFPVTSHGANEAVP